MRGRNKNWLVRIIAGGGLGLLVGVVWVPYVTNSRECPPLALLACAGLGVVAGVATQPFAESGRELLLRSAGHFAVTAALFALLVVELEITLDWTGVLAWEGLLALLYVLIWLGRWIGWYVELSQLRELLGLAPGPSPLKWRETVPYLPFVLVLCAVVPLALRGIERAVGTDFPALTGIVYPLFILPVASLCAGLSLGRRRGLCPLFPLACFVCYLPMVYVLDQTVALLHCFMTAVPALAGNIMGRVFPRKASKEGPGYGN